MAADWGRTKQKSASRARSRRSRDYGVVHRAIRRKLAPVVAAGLAHCVRCGELISAGSAWDLGHDDFDRSRWTGPEHPKCNRGAPHRERVSRVW